MFSNLSNRTHIRARPRRAFTLVEIMVVVAIIVILIGILIAVGTQVKRTAQVNATKATLETLRGCMSDYLKSNPEPGPANATANTIVQPLVWLPPLQADPNTATILKGMKSFTGATVQDGFGGTIIYIHSVKNPLGVVITPGYFVSPGPDGILGLPGQTPPDANAADNISGDAVNP